MVLGHPDLFGSAAGCLGSVYRLGLWCWADRLVVALTSLVREHSGSLSATGLVTALSTLWVSLLSSGSWWLVSPTSRSQAGLSADPPGQSGVGSPEVFDLQAE